MVWHGEAWHGVVWSSMIRYDMVWHSMVWKGRRQSAAYGELARHDGDKIEGGAAIIATASITSNKHINTLTQD